MRGLLIGVGVLAALGSLLFVAAQPRAAAPPAPMRCPEFQGRRDCALDLARNAGVVTGGAEACDIDPDRLFRFSARLKEALAEVTPDEADRRAALAVYTRTELRAAQQRSAGATRTPCPDLESSLSGLEHMVGLN